MARNPAGRHGLQGMTFGAMDAIINIVGIVVGLGVMGNRTAVFLGILVAGIANSFGNAWGFHVSEETENIHTRKEVWMSTGMSFAGTFLVTVFLLMPVLLLPLGQAIPVTVFLGMGLIAAIGLVVSRVQGRGRDGSLRLVAEYLGISILVISVAYLLGELASVMML